MYKQTNFEEYTIGNIYKVIVIYPIESKSLRNHETFMILDTIPQAQSINNPHTFTILSSSDPTRKIGSSYPITVAYREKGTHTTIVEEIL